MAGSYYDVIIVGTQLGSLFTGALLAKRGFRVLFVGHDHVQPTYSIGGLTLPRSPFAFVGAQSTAVERIFTELALHPSFRRHVVPAETLFQAVLPRHRLDFSTDENRLVREMDREFPKVTTSILGFLSKVRSLSAELEHIVARPNLWPPSSIFCRWDVTRLESSFLSGRSNQDLLQDFPSAHPFRVLAQMPVRFEGHMDPDVSVHVRTFRTWASWMDGAVDLSGGLPFLRTLLIDKIRSLGGEIRESERVESILTDRGSATGVRLSSSGSDVLGSFVLIGGELSSALRLIPDRTAFGELFEKVGEPQPRYFRFTTNLVANAAGIPAGMARHVFFVRDLEKPLSGENLLRIENYPMDAQGNRVMCVEALIARRYVEDKLALGSMREKVVASVETMVPFLREHLRIVDSPHDGNPPEFFDESLRSEPSDVWNRGPQTMQALWHYPITSVFGLCGIPPKTPIKKLMLCNEQVVPGLGLEGLAMTAWSVAQTITRADKRRERVRRGLWRSADLR